MPHSLYRFIWRVSGAHQIWITLLSVLLFAVGTSSLEVQRRIVNDALGRGVYRPILLLAGLYLGICMTEGLVKLCLNIYRNWVGENAVRTLRRSVFMTRHASMHTPVPDLTEGIQLSIVLDEADPIGGFVGEAFSEPVLQAGVLISVLGYLLYLQPLMALVVVFVFFPQIGFVPLMQNAINRRVQTRVGLLRQMSGAIVGAGGAVDADGRQFGRIQAIFLENMAIYKLKFSMNFLMNLMTQLGVTTILALGGYFVVGGKIEIGTVVAFLSGLSRINDPWGDLVTWYRDLQATRVKYGLLRDAQKLGAIAGGH
ncbi:ABC transporter transmembrane domain-containing protein [Labrys neptuniae]